MLPASKEGGGLVSAWPSCGGGGGLQATMIAAIRKHAPEAQPRIRMILSTLGIEDRFPASTPVA